MYYNDRTTVSGPGRIFFRITIAAAGVLAGFIVMRILFASIAVYDTAMAPSFQKGDRPVFLKIGTPERGEIVLIESPIEEDRYLISRVAAVEGDTVEMRDGVFLLNEKRVSADVKVSRKDERIFPLYFSFRDNMPPVKVGRNEFFVLNDNRDIGFDSRYYGKVGKERIRGVFFRNRR